MKNRLLQLNRFCLIIPTIILGIYYIKDLFTLLYEEYNYDGIRFSIYLLISDVSYLLLAFMYMYATGLKYFKYIALIFILMNLPLLFGVDYISIFGLSTSMVSLIVYFVYLRKSNE